MKIPPNTWKTCNDAWNGYHSVPLDKDSRHLTTFITPFGRFWYLVTPQGQKVSGDAYSSRYDAILTDFVRKTKCVDDFCGHDVKMSDHCFRICEFLTLTGNHGIIQNPDKFVFCKREVEFCGYCITDNGVLPSENTIAAIKHFPRPANITDIRSLFRLVEQVSYCFAKSSHMEPFRDLLKSKQGFEWNQELQNKFEAAKSEIVQQIQYGVQTYVKGHPTALVTDWSKTGVGYVLMQKHCRCTGLVLNCCSTGWKCVSIGSRFLSKAEENYAAIEGEMMGIVYALEKTKMWTLGDENLNIFTDHKPIVGMMTNKNVDDIPNTRL